MPDRRTLGTLLDTVSASGRTMIGMVAGLISERWPGIDRNRGRLHLGIPGRMKSESAARLFGQECQVRRHKCPFFIGHVRGVGFAS